MTLLPIGLTLISACLHAGWNLLARQSRGTEYLLHSSLLVCLVGLPIVFTIEIFGNPFPGNVWFYLTISGLCLAVYYLGLTRAYRSGDFSVVYPLARALPVLGIALLDVLLGHPPTRLGWIGIILVAIGCMLNPLNTLRGISLQCYWNLTTLWIIVAAAGITGYASADNLAADYLEPGLFSAMRYFVFQTMFSVVFYLLILMAIRSLPNLKPSQVSWNLPAILAVMIICAYSLVLWAFQLTSETSYVIAIRQFSIVIGVAIAALYFREVIPKLRIASVVIIISGIVLIVLRG